MNIASQIQSSLSNYPPSSQGSCQPGNGADSLQALFGEVSSVSVSARIGAIPQSPETHLEKADGEDEALSMVFVKVSRGIPPAIAQFAVFRTNKVFSGPNGARDNLLNSPVLSTAVVDGTTDASPLRTQASNKIIIQMPSNISTCLLKMIAPE